MILRSPDLEKNCIMKFHKKLVDLILFDKNTLKVIRSHNVLLNIYLKSRHLVLMIISIPYILSIPSVYISKRVVQLSVGHLNTQLDM